MDISDIRRRNLFRRIPDIHKHGAVSAFAREHNLDATYVRQILNSHRKMGEKAARKFEEAMRLETGALDQDGVRETASAYELSSTAIAVAKAFEASSPELQAAALRMLGAVRDIDKERGAE